jgi:uncharacterized protein YqeY
MTIQDQINLDLHQAMLNKDKDVLMFLRVVASELYKKGKVLDDEATKKELRTLNENAILMKNQGEIDILRKYLPAMFTENQVRTIVGDIISVNGFKGVKEMGKVMAELKKLPTASQIDNTFASKLTKELLNK